MISKSYCHVYRMKISNHWLIILSIHRAIQPHTGRKIRQDELSKIFLDLFMKQWLPNGPGFNILDYCMSDAIGYDIH